MSKKTGVLLLALLLLITLTSLASAEVFFSTQPDRTYSLGDTMQVSIGSDGTPGWASMDIFCSNNTKLLYYSPLNKETQKINIPVYLTKDFLRGMSGQCHLILTFGNETKQSMVFTLYDQVYIDIQFNKHDFKPNETLIFSGTASKPNKKEVNGFVEVSIENTALNSVLPVEKSKFSGQFQIPESLAAGIYTMKFFIYEKTESGEITNYGYLNSSISISQKAQELEIIVPEKANPDSSLEFKAVLKDHTGQTINSIPVSFKLINSNGEEVLNILSETDLSNYFNIQKNAPLGYWNLTAESQGVKQQKQIYVMENKEASFELINGTLIITNIGNTPYDNLVEIAIGEYTQVVSVNLTKGESVSFELEAPDGEYKVVVNDGSEKFTGTTALTGNAVAIKGAGKSSNFINKSLITWVFLILILGLFVFITSRKIIAGKTLLPTKLTKKSNKNLGEGGVLKVHPSKNQPGKLEKETGEAKYSLVTNGSKQSSSIITLKIKNNEEIKNAGMDISNHLNSIYKIITDNNGRIYNSGDYLIGIFAPVITKTFDNNFTTIKSAKQISDELNKFNKIAKIKIDFGIAVSAGEIIAKKQQGTLLFTPVGNILLNSKKMSEISENTLLISQEANKNIATKIKTVANPEKFGIKTYSLKEFIDKSENTKFINSFLKRNDYKPQDKLNKFKS